MRDDLCKMSGVNFVRIDIEDFRDHVHLLDKELLTYHNFCFFDFCQQLLCKLSIEVIIQTQSLESNLLTSVISDLQFLPSFVKFAQYSRRSYKP